MEFLVVADMAIDGYPCRDFGVHEMSGFASLFPKTLVGLSPHLLDMLHNRVQQLLLLLGAADTGVSGNIDALDKFSEYIELALRCRGVSDAHRRRPAIAREPGRVPLFQATRAIHTIHDAHLLRLAGYRAQQPVAPPLRFGVVIAGIDQSHEGERRVANPAESIVPVPVSAWPFGKRGRGGGNNSATAVIDHRLQRYQRTTDRIGPYGLLVKAIDPLPPVVLGVRKRFVRINRRRFGCETRAIDESERALFRFAQLEFA